MQTKQNQAITMYPLFFDPIYKKACFKQKDGKVSISYQDDICGVRLEEDGSVTFKMFAPKAKSVEIAGISGSMSTEKVALEKDETGYFTKTIPNISQGFHYHNWFVDGVKVVNPNASIAYGCFGATNFFEVPRSKDDFWLMKEVPHGDVQFRSYISGVNGHMKRCLVYTPPAYGKEDKCYPVLYVQHGVGENETGWIWNGKLNFILDNLIAEGKCEEMLVVMCSGYAFKENEDPVFYPGDFTKELVEDCIPYIESQFRVKKGRGNRAMAGLSLGSAQAIRTVARHQELFAHLGVFSGVKDDELTEIIKGHEAYPMQTILLTAGVGEEEINQVQEGFGKQIERLGIAGGQKIYEGYHEWHVWRESLRDFVMHLFRNNEKEDEEGFKLKDYEISNALLDKQTFSEHLLMFDPIYKDVIFEVDENGKPAGRYRDRHCGIEIVDANKGSARFYFYAPEAKSVDIDIWGMELGHMEKGEDGWWNCLVEGIEPGFHYYGIKVNGVDVVDGNAPVGYGGFRALNYLEMPEEDFEEYRIRKVPHGVIHMNYYESSETGRKKLCYVYTPPAYEKDLERSYPVLYLQHGGGENEIGWIWQGKIANIADNLIAKGKMKEMIIVMNTGYGFPVDKPYHPSMGSYLEEACSCCVEFIDKTYRTIACKENRAMAGLSMGAMQTQYVVLDHPELFSWCGLFSGLCEIHTEERDFSHILLDPDEFNKHYKLLFIACGRQEGFYQTVSKNVDAIKKARVPVEFFEDYGYHDWTFWRHCAKVFLPKLFV